MRPLSVLTNDQQNGILRAESGAVQGAWLSRDERSEVDRHRHLEKNVGNKNPQGRPKPQKFVEVIILLEVQSA